MVKKVLLGYFQCSQVQWEVFLFGNNSLRTRQSKTEEQLIHIIKKDVKARLDHKDLFRDCILNRVLCWNWGISTTVLKKSKWCSRWFVQVLKLDFCCCFNGLLEPVVVSFFFPLHREVLYDRLVGSCSLVLVLNRGRFVSCS